MKSGVSYSNTPVATLELSDYLVIHGFIRGIFDRPSRVSYPYMLKHARIRIVVSRLTSVGGLAAIRSPDFSLVGVHLRGAV